MHIIHINLPGAIICGVAFGIAFTAGYLWNISEEGPLMIIAGPLCIAMDLGYRFRRPERRWFHPDGGGNLFFIPLWLLGVLWLVLGVIDTVR